jgi:hypothetical protein
MLAVEEREVEARQGAQLDYRLRRKWDDRTDDRLAPPQARFGMVRSHG